VVLVRERYGAPDVGACRTIDIERRHTAADHLLEIARRVDAARIRI
jgi:hypothetical protein